MPHQRRLFFDHVFTEGQVVTIDSDAFHHFIRVWRCQVGDHITLFNTQAQVAHAQCLNITRREATFQLITVQPPQQYTQQHVDLGLVVLNAQAMDWVIEKATELGVHTFTPIYVKNTKKSLFSQAKQRHWYTKMIAACQQSGRNHLMQINSPIALEKWLPLNHNEIGLVATTYPQQNQFQKSIPAPPTKKIKCCVGPEAGWTTSEIQMIFNHHYQPVKLGDLTLRAETAGVVMVGLVLCSK